MTQLDPQQAKAVQTNSKRAMILAGAGSGKTRVLIERIVHLIDHRGVSPYEIMAFTFTRKAAGEMQSRLEQRINNAYKCTMGTMHSIAMQMIFKFGELIGLNPSRCTVYCEWEEQALLKSIAEELGFYKNRKWIEISKGEIKEAFDTLYNDGLAPDQYIEGPSSPIVDLYFHFIRRCRENNAITYGMLLLYLSRLIPSIAKNMGIKYILVDEVQDINTLQWQIINSMVEMFGAELFVVGDIDQSIYEFRGAVPKYLVDHQEQFDLYLLNTNYRSDEFIVNRANNLIAKNRGRIAKNMVSKRPGKRSVIIVGNTSSKDLVDLFATMDLKFPNQSKAILARNHAFLKKMSRIMSEREIKHSYIGRKTSLINTERSRKFHAFLKLLINPYDNFSFMLIREYLDLSPRDYHGIRMAAAKSGISHFNAYLKMFVPADVFNLSPFDKPTYHAQCIKKSWPNLDADNQVLDFIHKWSENYTGGVQEYLDWIAIMDIQDEIEENPDGVQLMTIHAAKGLEWQIVLIAGLNEGILPSKQSLSRNDIESERRLAYVAFTRAQNQLILTMRPLGKSGGQSRFVQESL